MNWVWAQPWSKDRQGLWDSWRDHFMLLREDRKVEIVSVLSVYAVEINKILDSIAPWLITQNVKAASLCGTFRSACAYQNFSFASNFNVTFSFFLENCEVRTLPWSCIFAAIGAALHCSRVPKLQLPTNVIEMFQDSTFQRKDCCKNLTKATNPQSPHLSPPHMGTLIVVFMKGCRLLEAYPCNLWVTQD